MLKKVKRKIITVGQQVFFLKQQYAIITGHFESPCASVSKRVFVQSLSYDSNDVFETEPVRETYIHMNGFARKLVLTQKQKAPIGLYQSCINSNLHKLGLAELVMANFLVDTLPQSRKARYILYERILH